MINFFKKKNTDLPDFWVNYENLFVTKQDQKLEDITFVVLDTETTGFSYEEDRMLCIGALKLIKNNINVSTSFEIFIHQDHYNQQTAEIHGILKEGKATRLEELETLKLFIAYLGNGVIVAHHAGFDVTFINTALERHGLPKLKNKILDTSTLYKKTLIRSNLLHKKEHYSLDELAEKFNISVKDRHTALGDAYITAIAFLKILSKLKEKNISTLKQLLRIY
ncbi:3'-5' exonuclease [Cellulophaga fucicola]|uniref:DNA polymerase-3 subunit epsilon n=1 Tax=Cellulophaga fucicola TaxID=76595 RepID=A0A1K1P5H4_9FLAO|nr:3'-5' exonuclease [Cellulophaga fucicola]SFW42701.1 DNA polymerase-3 subunit epsilon [Cellulophaga fucicola]